MSSSLHALATFKSMELFSDYHSDGIVRKGALRISGVIILDIISGLALEDHLGTVINKAVYKSFWYDKERPWILYRAITYTLCQRYYRTYFAGLVYLTVVWHTYFHKEDNMRKHVISSLRAACKNFSLNKDSTI
ncbi:hypothetical protein Ddc_10538 [Ditylenchus destructor]|nr:hypothetical protein Ddc_10538 [Ditylenchus destructor]